MGSFCSRRRVIRLGLFVCPAIAMILVLLPMASATTFTAPWQMPWYNNGGYPPCSGNNNWDGGNSNIPSIATGEFNMYSKSTATNSPFCGANNAYKTITEGLHGGYYFVGGTDGQGYSATFSYSMSITLLQYLACDGNPAASPYAQTEFFFAIYDVSTSTDSGNTYYSPQALLFSAGATCNSANGVWSAYNPAVCNQGFAPSLPVKVVGGNEYQPRVGVYTQTSSGTGGGGAGQSMNDLWSDYDSYCSADTGAFLNSMSFTGGPGGSLPEGTSLSVTITETSVNETSQG
jgi:hypothetical protein